jgi:hypothetical protein
MEVLPNKDIEFNTGKLPGGPKGIKFFGIKIRLSIQKLLRLFKKK